MYAPDRALSSHRRELLAFLFVKIHKFFLINPPRGKEAVRREIRCPSREGPLLFKNTRDSTIKITTLPILTLAPARSNKGIHFTKHGRKEEKNPPSLGPHYILS